jgi:hypothetical protein
MRNLPFLHSVPHASWLGELFLARYQELANDNAAMVPGGTGDDRGGQRYAKLDGWSGNARPRQCGRLINNTTSTPAYLGALAASAAQDGAWDEYELGGRDADQGVCSPTPRCSTTLY